MFFALVLFLIEYPCAFYNLRCSDHSLQVNINGFTGPIKFDDNGIRKGIGMEILNLRNNSFKKVRSVVPY